MYKVRVVTSEYGYHIECRHLLWPFWFYLVSEETLLKAIDTAEFYKKFLNFKSEVVHEA